jgi:hypothetical protein
MEDSPAGVASVEDSPAGVASVEDSPAGVDSVEDSPAVASMEAKLDAGIISQGEFDVMIQVHLRSLALED